ncbi:hypothetical protein CEY12_05900 [Chryseobacterium sp. T16E-39]|uniref:hypothetical protein n=1 Tax=Chryseobacterium sp. T16E-39 TaxID=2015076 RepID=UPI000B5B27FC|nr:hypothetical protein [Chryseobacterium sp. T16E-39]ASK29664.1 hypothetical protein CEY12_05900 [Chryseobacterium sp. T16E-39]
MLFKEVHLKGIKSGDITLAFRNWKKATVNSDSLLHTSIGLVKIHNVEAVNENDITDKDALNAGFTDKKELMKSLKDYNTGTLFKITVGYHSEDPRIELREQAELSEQQFADLTKKLDRMDQFSKQGAWTKSVLAAIKENPHLHAAGIATLTGSEKDLLKLNIRKLKNLGLTISHQVGYEISPLGNEYLKRLGNQIE